MVDQTREKSLPEEHHIYALHLRGTGANTVLRVIRARLDYKADRQLKWTLCGEGGNIWVDPATEARQLKTRFDGLETPPGV